MVGGAIGAAFNLFWILLILLTIIAVSFRYPRVGGISFLGLIGVLLVDHFAPIVRYEYNRFLVGGFHERMVEGGSYKVEIPSGDGFRIAGNKHPARQSRLGFRTTLSEEFVVTFGVASVAGSNDLHRTCDTIGQRYGLDEIDLWCAFDGREQYVIDHVYQETEASVPKVQLRCWEPVRPVRPDDQGCAASFWIGSFRIWALLNDDAERWPEVYSHLEQLLSEHFQIAVADDQS